MLLLRFFEIANLWTSKALRECRDSTRWFEKMESVFSISNCTQHLVKFTICDLLSAVRCSYMVESMLRPPLQTSSSCHAMGSTEENEFKGTDCVKASSRVPCKKFIEFTSELMEDKNPCYAERHGKKGKESMDDLHQNIKPNYAE
ncbi:hypothetical protein Tco_0755553 [Tanacetum coccineum]